MRYWTISSNIVNSYWFLRFQVTAPHLRCSPRQTSRQLLNYGIYRGRRNWESSYWNEWTGTTFSLWIEVVYLSYTERIKFLIRISLNAEWNRMESGRETLDKEERIRAHSLHLQPMDDLKDYSHEDAWNHSGGDHAEFVLLLRPNTRSILKEILSGETHLWIAMKRGETVEVGY